MYFNVVFEIKNLFQIGAEPEGLGGGDMLGYGHEASLLLLHPIHHAG